MSIGAVHVSGFVRKIALLAGGSIVTTIALAQRSVAADPRLPDLSNAETLLLNRSVTVDLDNVSVKTAIHAITTSAMVRVQYRERVIDALSQRVTLHTTKLPLGEALERALKGTSLRVMAVGSDFLTIAPALVAADVRQGGIQGKVTSAMTKEPLPGAKIGLDGDERVAQTAEDGTFRLLNLSAGPHTLTVKLLGYGKTARTIVVQNDAIATVDVMLDRAVTPLDQVVVTGTIIPTELKAVPNAMTVITAKDIEQRGITKINQLFRGDVPGLFAQNNGESSPLDSVIMFSRGATALRSGSTTPIKTYVDGIELANSAVLSQIDPQSIERIEILTGPQASTIYGSNAINGVMQIFTKRGTSARPVLNATLLSGFVQSDANSALTPQHDDVVQVSGVEGHISYHAEGGWNFVGAWTPAKRTVRTNTSSGVRLQRGSLTADASMRLAATQNRQRALFLHPIIALRETGAFIPDPQQTRSSPTTQTLVGQTIGVVFNYTPFTWWSHECAIGSDASNSERRITAPGHVTQVDTNVFIQQTTNTRQSVRYTSTLQMPISSVIQTNVTAGVDGWHTIETSVFANSTTLSGTLTGVPAISRQPGHNTGAFIQGQLGAGQRLFLTYGLRAEWNPNYGAAAEPDLAARYGLAHTSEWGPVTIKMRASYGRSTRPPLARQKAAQTITNFWTSLGSPSLATTYTKFYGNYDYNLDNAALKPESQGGGEGGLELYFGTHGSLVITHYNQTVDGLIDQPSVDSVRSLQPFPDLSDTPLDANGFGYNYQSQYVNIGSIRNQGWELQGTASAGPITTKGTYSWTKSRTIGVDARFRSYFSAFGPQYLPGGSFTFLPEHTWAANLTYARQGTSVALTMNGTGFLYRVADDLGLATSSLVRLPSMRPRVSLPPGYRAIGPSYITSDMNAFHRLTAAVDGILQIQNLTNNFRNDSRAQFAALGRQVKFGIRGKL